MSSDELQSAGDGAQIAVIGMAGRFPGARNTEEFWQNLATGKESVRFFSEQELLAVGETPEMLADPAYVQAWPVLADIERFDAGFFGMSPRDAAVMDPQHRFFLEVAWHALEHAGYAPEGTPASTGVFAACGMNTYMMHHLVRNQEVMKTVGEWLIRHTGNDMNFLATRLSYQMNLKGPSLNVQTACSSALVAVHLACQSLLNGECDMALAGASTMSLPQDRGYLFHEGEILSPDGHCRPFDAAASGTLFGSGTGCVVLKRLSDALADGDHVLAVIRGSAINNDGSAKVGYLAPSVEGQARAISEALAISGVEPESISYVEAHGTGTAVGDPIEVAALTQAYRAYTDKAGFCALGSAKGNIGHLGEAAGMAGLIKTILALRERKLPPSINYSKPNPEIDFTGTPFVVNQTLRDWPDAGGAPRRAGITALGAGGTNAHLIVEEAPHRPPSTATSRPQLLLLSARSSAALDNAAAALAHYLEEDTSASLGDVAATLQLGRRHFAQRLALVARDRASAIALLRSSDPKQLVKQRATQPDSSVVFMFPGGGAQYAGMGAELYESEPEYRTAFDACFAALPLALSTQLRALVLASGDAQANASSQLERPSLALPALFATEYATAKLLMSRGLAPVAYIGHSMGEYVAACLAGVFSISEGMALVTARGRLFETLPEGGMLSVALPELELQPLLTPELSIAAVNARGLCVASGPVSAIDALRERLEQRDIDCTKIHISVAAHSSMLEPILAEFEAICRGVRLQPPQLPFVSNLSGTWIAPAEATDPLYWVRHLRSTVRFAQGIDQLLQGEARVLLEVGPGRTLASLSRQHPSAPAAHATLRHPQELVSDSDFLYLSLGKVWASGGRLDFQALRGSAPWQRVPLPGYPFEGERYWIEPSPTTQAAPKATGELRKIHDLKRWFSVPMWRRTPIAPAAPASGPWLVFSDAAGLLEQASVGWPGQRIIRVVPGESFSKLDDHRYALRADAPVDYESLFSDLALRELLPHHVVYGWSVSAPAPVWSLRLLEVKSALSDLSRAEQSCFFGLLFLAQALGPLEMPVTLSVISDGLHSMLGNKRAAPEKAVLLGPLRVIPREFPQIRTRSIDVELPSKRAELERVARGLGEELLAEPRDALIALRNSGRWVQEYDALPLEPRQSGARPIREGGVYLITGGLGGIGLELAKHLSESAKAKLILVGRTGLPERAQWPEFLKDRDAVASRIRKVQEIEAHGGEVLVLGADVTSFEEMRNVVQLGRERFGRIHGVVHAAGLLDDGLISLKTQEQAARVLAVKTHGALALDAALGAGALDFFVVFSSVSSVLGLEGQVDYTAANAFLDAFAENKAAEGNTHCVSIGWNAWSEIGMAVSLAEQPVGVELASAATHPWLERVAVDNLADRRFVTRFSRTKHWLLSEHVVRGGDALIPGTGYLELARAGLAHHRQKAPIAIRDVTFLSPFVVRTGESRELRLSLTREDPHDTDYEFRFYSDAEQEPHVTGRIGYVERQRPAPVSLRELQARCAERPRVFGGFLDQSFMDFGPRWANVDRLGFHDREALIALFLPAPFLTDLSEFELHPALLDMATGGAQALLEGFDPARDFFVPMAYGKVTIFGPLTPRCFSHVRHQHSSSNEIALFDISIYDPQGNLLVEIENFTMRKISSVAVLTDARPRTGPESVSARSRPETRIGGAVRLGITNREGMDAFERVLSARIGGQVLASSVDLHAWLDDIEARARPPTSTNLPDGQTEAGGAGFARPSLSREFVAPRNQIERDLAAIWRELLGVAQVGVHDDFFEIGGTSLVAVRLFNKIRKKYDVPLPLSTLFEAPNIEGCAKIIAEELGLSLDSLEPNDSAPTTLRAGTAVTNGVAAHDAAAKKSRWPTLVVMQPKGVPPAFFCIAGLGGNLNNLRKLAILAGDERPVYGLQPPGADDPKKLIYSVPALADHYLEEVRKVQPHGPYFLGGYSGGGITAFEMCRRLSEQGEAVAFLGLLDSYSPELPERSKLERAQIHLRRLSDQGPQYLLETLGRRAQYEQYELRRRVSRKLRGVFPDRLRYQQMEDAWLVAQAAYKPPAWEGRATLFRARELGSMSLWTAVKDDEYHGWGRYLLGGVDVKLCPGNHNSMCEEPNVRVLASHLREAIKHAAASVGPSSNSGAAPSAAAAPPSRARNSELLELASVRFGRD